MNWEIVITASVIASLVSGVFILVKTILDNRAKKNDSIRLFKYTKLYEILSDWYNIVDELGGKVEKIAYEDSESWNKIELDIIQTEPIRIEQLKKSYKLAKPLISQKHQKILDEKFDEFRRRRWDIIQIGKTDHVVPVHEKRGLLRIGIELQERFESIIGCELESLMSQ